MPKIRWTTQCVGCRRVLPAGSRGYRYHRVWWCGDCATTHRETCTAHRTDIPVVASELVLF